jgi:hypothetical protein
MKRLVILVALVVAACGDAGATAEVSTIHVPEPTRNPTPSAADGPTQAVTPEPNAPTPEPTPEPAGDFVTFEDGTYVVGEDVKPGTYRTREPHDGCYWERLSGFSGNDTITNELTNDLTVVTVAKSDAGFSSSGCGTWTSDLSRVTESKTTFGPGTFIVGVDIAAGRYRNSGGDLCYWERLSDFSGEGIITNDLTDGPTIMTIKASDKGFSSTDCGTWTRR